MKRLDGTSRDRHRRRSRRRAWDRACTRSGGCDHRGDRHQCRGCTRHRGRVPGPWRSCDRPRVRRQRPRAGRSGRRSRRRRVRRPADPGEQRAHVHARHPARSTRRRGHGGILDERQSSARSTSCRPRFAALTEHGGKILNIGSGSALDGDAGSASYASAKEGVRVLTHVAAREWGPHGIHVNTLCPFSRSPRWEAFAAEHPGRVERQAASMPLRRAPGDPELDIGRAAVFLLSDDSSYVTGQTLFVEGGACGREPATRLATRRTSARHRRHALSTRSVGRVGSVVLPDPRLGHPTLGTCRLLARHASSPLLGRGVRPNDTLGWHRRARRVQPVRMAGVRRPPTRRTGLASATRRQLGDESTAGAAPLRTAHASRRSHSSTRAAQRLAKQGWRDRAAAVRRLRARVAQRTRRARP